MIKDEDCINLLQQHLPRLGYRWKGFRKVRKQVCKRIGKRIRELGLDGILAYAAYLEIHGEEMQVLDALCNITISRFYRDRGVYDNIAGQVFPSLAGMARQKHMERIRCWCAGSASGEEPYTLSIIWKMLDAGEGLSLKIIATDRNAHMIRRAEEGIYPGGGLKELPGDLKAQAFKKKENHYQIRQDYRADVRFMQQDIRAEMPEGSFDLILCRNLVFTYFQEDLQRRVFRRIMTKLHHGGYLVIGIHEHLPLTQKDLVRVSKCVFRMRGNANQYFHRWLSALPDYVFQLFATFTA